MHSLGTSALSLAERGLFIFPCLPRDKRPATGHGVKDATRDLDVIRHWWGENPDYNVAAATGPNSNIFVIDVDDAEAELSKLEAANSPLPPTVESITATGRHLFFRWPGFEIRNSASKLAPGIDVRGAGGYVVVPPSIHPSGRAYCWSVDCARKVVEAPKWLLSRLGGTGSTQASTPPAEWRALVHDGVGEGQRNDAITRLCGYLLCHRINAAVALEMLLSWNTTHCRPPLSAGEVAAIVDSIAGRELKRRGAI